MLQSSSLIKEMCLPLLKLVHRWGQLERTPKLKLEEKTINQICVRLILEKHPPKSLMLLGHGVDFL
jgi:hypothetical protein